jgi:dTDP-4-dehydrorhamnose reductase
VRVAVIGARGQLGAAIVHEFSSRHEVAALAREALNINDAEAVDAMLSRISPELIVNCAAYNAVDAAEDHPVEALQTNAIAVRSLARAARNSGAMLVHFSSDFVFDGLTDRPYVETDPPNPRSVYAASKLLGEWFAADAPHAYVLRVESLFGRAPEGPPAKGSAETILTALRKGSAARVFEDRTVSPTYIPDAARAVCELIERRPPAGLYHCVNSGHCTWLDLAYEAARLIGVEPRFERLRVADVPLRAVRPQYCALSNAKLAAAGISMPSWHDALSRYLEPARHDLAHQLSDG